MRAPVPQSCCCSYGPLSASQYRSSAVIRPFFANPIFTRPWKAGLTRPM
jgi:hypothetical protein